MEDPAWHLEEGEGPLVAAANHDGHEVRPEVAALLALSDAQRLIEEDPGTGEWTRVAPTRIVVRRSRFEVDLNRPREKAVYLTPEDSWGLRVWRSAPPGDLVERSLSRYDAYYAEARRVLSERVRRHGRVIVLDLHSYNHHRTGPAGPCADPQLNPEVNVGTGTMARERWAPVVERFIRDLRAFDFLGRHLDVRENVKYKGAQFPRWIHREYPESVCALAVEFKKFFMDEHTGAFFEETYRAIARALESTIPGLLEVLGRIDGKA